MLQVLFAADRATNLGFSLQLFYQFHLLFEAICQDEVVVPLDTEQVSPSYRN